MPYIESHTELADHPKLKKLMRLLRITRAEAVGHLHLLWWWSWFYSREGSLAGYGAEEIADAADWKGDAQEFVTALLSCGRDKGKGFLEHDALGDLYIHDWPEYAGKYIERCKANAERARTSRERKRMEREAYVANISELNTANQTLHTAPIEDASSRPAASPTDNTHNLPKPYARPIAVSRDIALEPTKEPPPSHPSSRVTKTTPRASGSIVPAHGASVDKPSEEKQADWRVLVDSVQANAPIYAGGIPPVVLDDLRRWHKDLSAACILQAIKEAHKNGALGANGAPKWNYVGTICERWIEAGVTQLEDVKPLTEAHEYRKAQDKHAQQRDPTVFAPLSQEDKQKADAITKELAARLGINKKVVR